MATQVPSLEVLAVWLKGPNANRAMPAREQNCLQSSCLLEQRGHGGMGLLEVLESPGSSVEDSFEPTVQATDTDILEHMC